MLSFGKILLLVVVAVVVILGFRLIGAMKHGSAREQPPPPPPRPAREGPAAKAADLSACPACGAYTDGPCERPDCGFGR